MLIFLGANAAGRDDLDVINLGDALARTGFVVMFHWSPTMGLQNNIDPEEIEGLVQAFQYLLAQNYVDRARAGMGGFSVGVETMLRVLEETVPVQRIWLDTVEKGELQKGAFADSASADLETILLVLHRHLVKTVGLTPDKAREQLLATEPFQNFPELVKGLPNHMDP